MSRLVTLCWIGTASSQMMRPNNDSPCKDVILKALTRLNERSTLRAAAEELCIIVRALDQESLSALVQSICSSTGAWEPKPVAKKECIRVLAQLPLASCPVADAVLQHHLPKVLVYLRKTLQDADGLVREASSEALAAYAQGMARLQGDVVPGNTTSPVVKVVFSCLTEQKKEGQIGASHALLKMSPYLGPLDKELVKTILKLLRSPAFLGTAQLLAAIASIDTELQGPVGLLKHGAAAFLPYISHLIGQPSQRQASGTASSAQGKANSGSGILGCLSSQDWAVRRAAADAVRAAVLALGPELEPEGCWGLGDAGSVTGRCLDALEDCRFDKVKEAREAAREATALITQLHRFVSEQGPGGDWPSWAANNLPYAGLQATSRGGSPATHSPPGSRQLGLQHTSPIAERFRRAAAEGDVVVAPGSRGAEQDGAELVAGGADTAGAAWAEGMEEPRSEGSSPLLGGGSAVCAEGSVQQEPTTHGAAVPDDSLAAEQSKASVSSSVRDDGAPVRQQSQQSQRRTQWPDGTAAGGVPSAAPSGRPSSSLSSRPGSTCSSRRISATDQSGLAKQSSQGSLSGVPSYAAGTRSSAARAGLAAGGGKGAGTAGGKPSSGLPASSNRAKGAATRVPLAAAAPAETRNTQDELEQLQHQLQEQQQLVLHLQQQAAANQARHEQELQALRESGAASTAALQDRLAALEAQVQRQQLVMQEQRQLIEQQQQQLKQQQQQLKQHTVASSQEAGTPSRRSPSKCSSSPASGTALSAAAAVAFDSPIAGVQEQACVLQQHSAVSEGPPSSNRLYKSAEWCTPQSGSGCMRKALISPGQLTASCNRSYNSLMTPLSASTGMKSCESGAVTPGDVEGAYADALQNERGGVHLMRLSQKTGPVWQQLSPSTSQRLLKVFISHVRDGVMLHRVLPWLWRLADEDAGRPDVPQPLQQQLLEALEVCPAAEELQSQEKVGLLLTTLKAVWTAV